MAIVLPNFGEQLGKDIEGLGAGISHMVDPLLDFHTKFRAALAENPEILQKLTDYAYLNNGNFGPVAKFLPKDVTEGALKATPSIEARQHKGLTDAFSSIDPDTRNLFLRAKALGVSDPTKLVTEPAQVANVQKVLKDHPELGDFIGYKALTGEGPGRVSEDQMIAEMGPAAREYYYKVMTPEDRQAAAADKYGLLQDKHFQQSLQFRKDMWEMRSLDRVDHYQDSEANSWFNKTGGVGTPDGWRKLLYDPRTRDRLDKLKSGQGGTLTDDDISLLQMDRARKEAGAQYERTHNKASVVGLRDAYDRINGNPDKKVREDTDSERAIDLQVINNELNFLGLPYQAMYGQSPKLQGKGIRGIKGPGDITSGALRTKLRFINPKTKEEANPDDILGTLESDYRLGESEHGSLPSAERPSSGEGHTISLNDMKPEDRRFAVGTLGNARAALAVPGADTTAIRQRIVDKSNPQVAAYVLKQLGIQ